jgi:hypothetical protein
MSFLSRLGYIDDVRNTDNAWVEAEIWNFHYGSTMSFPNLRTDVGLNCRRESDKDRARFLGYGFMERCHLQFSRLRHANVDSA